MQSAEFHHFGVQASKPVEGSDYIEGAKVYVSNPEAHPYRVEFLCFEDDSPMHEAVRTRPHAAFVVPSLDEALKGQNVIIPPFDATPALRCAFIMDGEAVIEVMERK
jgi:hypothetical protein